MAINEAHDFESIAIVGGGISGIYAAWLLTRALAEPEYVDDGRKRRIVLLETSDRLGGRIETVDFSTSAAGPEDCGCGRLLAEFGPMRFEEPVQNRFRALCEALEVKRRDFPRYRGERISYPKYQLVQSERWERGVREDLGSLELLQLGLLRLVREAVRADPTYPGPPLPDLAMRAEDVFTLNAEGEFDAVEAYAQWFRDTTEATYGFMRQQAKVGGILLHRIGLWNALEMVLSHQAVMKVRDLGTFYHLLPHNPNAAEWAVFWLRGFGLPPDENMKQIVGGSARLITALARQLGSVDIRMRHEVVGVGREPASERVVLQVRDKTEPHEPVFDLVVDHAILALPAGALKELCDNFPSRIRAHLESVIGFPLVKGFLVTDDPWWKPGQKPQAGAGQVPTRELHYYTEAPAAEEGRTTGMVLMYTDHPADEFWRTFVELGGNHDRASLFMAAGRRARALGWSEAGTSEEELFAGRGARGLDDNELLLRTMVRFLVDDCRPASLEFGEQIVERLLDVMEGDRAKAIVKIRDANRSAENDRRAGVFQDALSHRERQALYELLVRQRDDGVALLGDPRVVAVSEDLFDEERGRVQLCALRDWSRRPFFAGCHVWKPGAKSWVAAADLTSFGLLGARGAGNCHVCGEAYSDYQGFIEGALRSAELVVASIVGPELRARIEPPEVDLGARRFANHETECTVVPGRPGPPA